MLTITEQNRKWWILAAMICSLSMVFVDQTAVSVALPDMQKDLHMSGIALQWVVNAYLLAIAAVVIFGGKVADTFGHRRVFLAGVLVFVLSSVCCALSMAGWWALMSRALQGIGAAFMVPASSAIIFGAFTTQERGKAMGLYVGISAFFASIGPFVGGILTGYLSWRFVFWINFPIAVIAMVLSLMAVAADTKRDTSWKRLDWSGFIFLVVAMLTLVYGLMEATRVGWQSSEILILLVISVLSVIIFYVIERRTMQPLVDFTLFKRADFLRAVLLWMIIQAGFVSIIFWAIYFQDVLDYSPQMSGVLILPLTLPIVCMAPVAGKLFDKFGARMPVSVGMLLLMLASLWGAVFIWHQSYWVLIVGLILTGCGAPLVSSSTMATGLGAVDLTQRATAAGIISSARQFGGSFGLAIMGSIILNGTHYRLNHFLHAVGKDFSGLNATQLDGLLAGAASAKKAVEALPAVSVKAVIDAAKHAFTFGLSMGLIFVTFTAVIGFLLARRLPGKPIK